MYVVTIDYVEHVVTLSGRSASDKATDHRFALDQMSELTND